MSTSVVRWSEDLNNSVSIIIRRYIDHMKCCCLYGCLVYHILLYSFGSVSHHCMYGCVFCVLLFSFVNYVTLLLCLCIPIMFIYFYSYIYVLLCLRVLIVMYVPFCVCCFIVMFCVLCVCVCVCVNVYCTAVTGCQPNCS